MKRRSDLEWQELIREYDSSGLSAKAWCAVKDIPANTFYYHVRKLRKTKAFSLQDVAEKPELVTEVVPLVVSEELPAVQEPGAETFSASSCLMLHCHDIHVSVPEQTSPSLIRNVVNALQALC